MRCAFCKSNNPEGAALCQTCGSRLPVLMCSRCYFENPPEYRFCGGCGKPLLTTAPGEVAAREEEQEPRQRKIHKSRPPSPVALIGFGAVLALASAAFPWYLLGGTTSPKAAAGTISDLLALGWQWFPGLPLALITIGAVFSTFLAVLAGRGRSHLIVAVIVGLVILINAAWLGLGLQAPPATAPEVVPTSTGPMLALIGAIVIVASGSWLVWQLKTGMPPPPPPS